MKKKDKYNYFPFVSGDLIEKHRANLGAQLKNDLQSFMDYQKKNSSISTHRNKSSKGTSVNVGGAPYAQSYDAHSVRSFYQTGAGNPSSNRSRAVK